jgi:type IV pilus assembly protein PilN
MLRFNFAETRESKFAKYIRVDVLFIVFLVSLVFAIDLYWERAITREITKVESEIQKLELEKKKFKKIEKKRRKLIKYRKELQKKLAVVKELEKKRYVPQFLYFFGNEKNVAGVWLDSVSYHGNSLSIEGNSLNLEYLYSFIRKLDNNLGTVFFKGASLQSMELKNLNKKVDYYKFQVNVELKDGVSH